MRCPRCKVEFTDGDAARSHSFADCDANMKELMEHKTCMCDGGGSIAHEPSPRCTSGPYYDNKENEQ